jgi:HK97 family phage major capsid protein/HK97 family phage prohead protease
MSAKTHIPATTRYSGVLKELSAAEEKNLGDIVVDGKEVRGVPKKLGQQFRKVAKAAYDKDAHTVTMAVSSETPVDRYYGQEILSHGKGAVRTDRLSGGVSLLYNHDYDQLLGRSQSFELGEPIHVTCRFGTSALAAEKELDVAADILVDVSIGYIVYEWDIVEDKNGVRTYTAVDWEILEVSLVTVPADPTVGVGRSSDVAPKIRSFRKVDDDSSSEDDDGNDDAEEQGDDDGAESERTTDTTVADPTPQPSEPTPTTPTPARSVPMSTEVIANPAADNAARVAGLNNLRTLYPNEFSERALKAAVDLDTPLDAVKRSISDTIISAGDRNTVPTIADDIFGGMSERELGQYSLRNVYAAAVNRAIPGSFSDPGSEAGFEREVGETLRKAASARGVTGLGGGILIPSASSRASAMIRAAQRTLASGGNAGQFTNVTTVEADPIELLRSRTAVLALGARMMTGLFGTISMPRQTGAATSSWVSEGSAVASTDPSLDAISISPKPLMIASSYYRNLLAQSRLAVDSFLAQDRDRVLALSLDTAALAGSGVAPIPLGLLNQAGLPAILAGTTRAATGVVTPGLGGVPMTYVDFNDMEASISMANADIGAMGWLTTPKVRAAARSTPQIPGTASQFVWPNSKPDGRGIQEGPLGYNALCTSNALLTGFTANSVANLHAVILGVWDQIIIGDWGLSEIVVDPYTGASSQMIKITENAYFDTNVRHLAAFCACTSALPS